MINDSFLQNWDKYVLGIENPATKKDKLGEISERIAELDKLIEEEDKKIEALKIEFYALRHAKK